MPSHKISAYNHTSNENPSHDILRADDGCDLDTRNSKITLKIIPVGGGSGSDITFSYNDDDTGSSKVFGNATLRISGRFTMSSNTINGSITRIHTRVDSLGDVIGDENDTGTFSATHNW